MTCSVSKPHEQINSVVLDQTVTYEFFRELSWSTMKNGLKVHYLIPIKNWESCNRDDLTGTFTEKTGVAIRINSIQKLLLPEFLPPLTKKILKELLEN